MAKEFAKPFYNSSAWIKCRNAYRQHVNGLCEKCLEDGKTVPGDEIHHKISLTPENISNPEITLSWDNLQLLCFTCHQDITHNRTSYIRSDVMFDSSGNLVKRNEVRPPFRRK